MGAALEMKGVGKRYKFAMVIMSILVFMSTLFIKQHVIPDFFGAIIVAEAGRFIIEFLHANRCAILEKRGKTI